MKWSHRLLAENVKARREATEIDRLKDAAMYMYIDVRRNTDIYFGLVLKKGVVSNERLHQN